MTDIMSMKKTLLDDLGAGLAQMSSQLSMNKAKILTFTDEGDTKRIQNLGISDSIADAEKVMAATRAKHTEAEANNIRNFLTDEPGLRVVLLELGEKTGQMKGMAKILDEIKEDRKAAEKRQKSQNEYHIKRDVKKYMSKGVIRKIGLALIRCEAPDIADGLDIVPSTTFATWKPAEVSIHTTEELEGDVYSLVTLLAEAMDEKFALLKKS